MHKPGGTPKLKKKSDTFPFLQTNSNIWEFFIKIVKEIEKFEIRGRTGEFSTCTIKGIVRLKEGMWYSWTGINT